MGNRKQPFGYRVVMGEIALHPQESKLVACPNDGPSAKCYLDHPKWPVEIPLTALYNN